MFRSISLLSLCLVGILAVQPSRAADAPPPRADVVQLMQISGAGNIVQELAPLISRQITAAMRRANPSVSDRTVQIVTQVATSYMTDPTRTRELIDQIAAVYANTFTPAEIQQLIAFYGTPVGRKLAPSLPQITTESAQIGQAWALRMVPGLREAITARLSAEGLTP
jgi:hypothetical protein